MLKKTSPPPPPALSQNKPPVGRSSQKAPEKKAFNPEDYVTMTIPLEEVKDIKMAFDIFDGDLSGEIDPQELK